MGTRLWKFIESFFVRNNYLSKISPALEIKHYIAGVHTKIQVSDAVYTQTENDYLRNTQIIMLCGHLTHDTLRNIWWKGVGYNESSVKQLPQKLHHSNQIYTSAFLSARFWSMNGFHRASIVYT